MERGDRPRRARAQRRSAQSPFAVRRHFRRARAQALAARRRVRRDYTGDARAARRVNDQLKLAFAEVWGNLDEQRERCASVERGKLSVATLKFFEQRGQK